MSCFKGRGAFNILEGMDRCWKSTQVQLLSKHLKSIAATATAATDSSPLSSVEDIRFPNRDSRIGQLINSYLSSTSELSDQTVHLLFSANRWEQAKDIEEKLKAGITLVG
jgi:dTMP kinase